jgi:DNA repair protein RadC
MGKCRTLEVKVIKTRKVKNGNIKARFIHPRQGVIWSVFIPLDNGVKIGDTICVHDFPEGSEADKHKLTWFVHKID